MTGVCTCMIGVCTCINGVGTCMIGMCMIGPYMPYVLGRPPAAPTPGSEVSYDVILCHLMSYDDVILCHVMSSYVI